MPKFSKRKTLFSGAAVAALCLDLLLAAGCATLHATGENISRWTQAEQKKWRDALSPVAEGLLYDKPLTAEGQDIDRRLSGDRMPSGF